MLKKENEKRKNRLFICLFGKKDAKKEKSKSSQACIGKRKNEKLENPLVCIG